MVSKTEVDKIGGLSSLQFHLCQVQKSVWSKKNIITKYLVDTKVFTRLLFLQYHDLNHMTQRLWSGDGNSQSFWVFQFLRGGFSESDAVPPLKIRLQRAFSVFMWVQIAKCRQGQAQHTWAQSSHPQRGLFAYLLF